MYSANTAPAPTTVEEELYAIHWAATIASVQNGLETSNDPFWTGHEKLHMKEIQAQMQMQPPTPSSCSPPSSTSCWSTYDLAANLQQSKEYIFPSVSPCPQPPSLLRRQTASMEGRTCSNCNATSTPLWRRCPDTRSILCNACGLYTLQHHKRRPLSLSIVPPPPSSPPTSTSSSTTATTINQCSHCQTFTTSVWRRHNETGALLCNACGVYARLRGKDRPLSLKKDRVKPRATRRGSDSGAVSVNANTVWIMHTP